MGLSQENVKRLNDLSYMYSGSRHCVPPMGQPYSALELALKPRYLGHQDYLLSDKSEIRGINQT